MKFQRLDLRSLPSNDICPLIDLPAFFRLQQVNWLVVVSIARTPHPATKKRSYRDWMGKIVSSSWEDPKNLRLWKSNPPAITYPNVILGISNLTTITMEKPLSLVIGYPTPPSIKKPRLKGKSRCDRIHLAKEGYLKFNVSTTSKNVTFGWVEIGVEAFFFISICHCFFWESDKDSKDAICEKGFAAGKTFCWKETREILVGLNMCVQRLLPATCLVQTARHWQKIMQAVRYVILKLSVFSGIYVSK